MSEDKLIYDLTLQKPKAQKLLYEKYAARWFALCLRYLKEYEIAEDAMISGFMKIFSNIKKFVPNSNFEGWMYKIMVNECLMELRKNTNFNVKIEISQIKNFSNDTILDDLYEKDVMKYLDYLPLGCRTVFNLFVIEGYKHSEIAEMLHITEGTSKSQLNAAKERLKEILPKEYQKNNVKL